MKSIARSISRASCSYRVPAGEVRTKPRFQSCTRCRSASPPVAKARSRLSVEAAVWYARSSRPGSACRASAVAARSLTMSPRYDGRPSESSRGRARLGELPGDPGHLHHRHARRVGQHDGHLQQRLQRRPQRRLGRPGEGLRAVAALQQEGLAAGHRGEPGPQRVHLVRHHQRGQRAQRGGRPPAAPPGQASPAAAPRAALATGPVRTNRRSPAQTSQRLDPPRVDLQPSGRPRPAASTSIAS